MGSLEHKPLQFVTSPLPYRPEIDGLRAIAVLVVVFFHAKLGCPGGYVGVDVFFVISGFLITTILLREIESGQFRLRDFWERRIRRIAPALMVTVLATIIAAWLFFLPRDFVALGEAVVALTLCGANIYHWYVTGCFGRDAETLPLLHTWSLAVEEQFYILLPVVLVAIGHLRKSWLRPAIALAFVLSLGFGIWATPRMVSSSFFMLPARTWELLLGSLLASYPAWSEKARRGVREFVCLMGLAAIGFAVLYYDEHTLFPGTAALVPCGGAAAILWANAAKLTRIGRFLAWKPLVFVGKVSYSFYLIHWPLFTFPLYWFRNEIKWPTMLSLVGVAFVLAVLSWKLVEMPVRKSSVLPGRRRIFACAGAAAVLLFATGKFIEFEHGFPSRFDSQTLAYDRPRHERFRYGNLPLADAEAGRFPLIGAKQGATKCLVWGDSHAVVLMPLLNELCQEKGIRLYRATYVATAPLLNFVSESEFSLRERTPRFSQAVVDFAIDQEITAVFMIAMWTNYSGPQFEPCLRATLARLTNAGIKVFIVRDVPRQAEDVCFLLTKASLFGDVRTIGVSLEKHRKNNSVVNATLERFAGPRVTLLYPSPYFVDKDGFCRAELDGQGLYRDDHHLSESGAQRLRPLFEGPLDELSKESTPESAPSKS